MQCLLSQHPEIYGSSTSPLLEYWYGAYTNYTLPEVRSQPADLMQNAFTGLCREGAKGYYSALTDRPVVVDKCRGWLECAEMLWAAFPEAKIVTMVRNINAILESLDKVYKKYPGHPDARHLPKNREQRFQFWAKSGSLPLGAALDRLKLRQEKGPDPRIMYVKYGDLTNHPVEVMRSVFTHLGVDPIDVDPNNITKLAIEDDMPFGIFGDHKVKSKIVK